jgi:protein-tyrosine sulfotransferase
LIKYYFHRIKLELKFQLAKRRSNSFAHELQRVKNQPFYIVSAGRSGSTLLRRLLMAGGEIHIPPESDDFQVKIFLQHLEQSEMTWPMQCQELSELYDKSGLNKFWGISRNEYYQYLLSTPVQEQTLYSKIWSLHHLHAQNNAAQHKRVADKTPLLVEWMPWLHLVNSNVIFIFLIRDIRDVIASRMKYFNESPEKAFRRYYTAMRAAEKFKELQPSHFLQIRYEDLVYNTKDILSQLCNRTGLLYSDDMLTDPLQKLGDDHLPHHTEVHLPVSDKGIGRWKDQLDENSLKKIYELVESKKLDKNTIFFNRADVN